MKTSKEIYNQIKWDSSLQEKDFVLGCQGRFEGIMEIAFVEFGPDSIPWSRVVFFKKRGVIVWDRRDGLDRFGDETIKTIDEQGLPGTIEATEEHLFPLPFFSYSVSQKRWGAVSFESLPSEKRRIALQTFKVVTWNLLYDPRREGDIYTNQRIPLIFSALQESRADVMALEEVTPSLWAKLLQQDWVRRDYLVSDSPEGETLDPYGVALLSKLPLTELRWRHFSREKKVLAVEVSLAGCPVSVGVVHLSSPKAKNALQKRSFQLQILLDHLARPLEGPARASLVMGDFNFSSEEEANRLYEEGLEDLWNTLYPGVAGATFDPPLNELAALTSSSGNPSRYDRIYWSSGSALLVPERTWRFGTEPKREGVKLLYPSDHFGLAGIFRVYPRELKPSYHSALVVIPPEECWAPLQEIRQKYDRQFHRWMPHINLLYGFLSEEHFEGASEILGDHLLSFSPFKLSLSEFCSFEHSSSSSTLYLKSEGYPPGILQDLQSDLQRLFPMCQEQSQKSPWKYTPHLSLGQFRSSEVREEVMKSLQKNWVPLSFEVGEICLISRTGEGPFEVKKRLALGQRKSSSSVSLSSGKSPLSERTSQREEIPLLLKKLNRAWKKGLEEKGIPAPIDVGYLTGSTYLIPQEPSGDLDLIFIGPPSISRGEFFDWMEKEIQEMGPIESLVRVEEALVPLMKVKMGGHSLDFLYGSYPEGVSLCHPQYLSPREWGLFEEKDRWSLLAALEGREILRSLGGRSKIFLDLLPLVKQWARSREIYSNGFGFWGGYSWTLLLAWFLKDRQPFSSVREALGSFFSTLVRWDWKRPLAFSPEALPCLRSPRRKMVILTPLFPHKNSARNVTPFTQKIMEKEFWRGRETLENFKGEGWEEALLKPLPKDGHPFFLHLEIWGSSSENFDKIRGWVEGKILSLLFKLKKIPTLELRPFPGLLKPAGKEGEKDPWKGAYLVGLGGSWDRRDVERKVQNFIDSLPEKYSSGSLSFRILSP